MVGKILAMSVIVIVAVGLLGRRRRADPHKGADLLKVASFSFPPAFPVGRPLLSGYLLFASVIARAGAISSNSRELGDDLPADHPGSCPPSCLDALCRRADNPLVVA